MISVGPKNLNHLPQRDPWGEFLSTSSANSPPISLYFLDQLKPPPPPPLPSSSLLYPIHFLCQKILSKLEKFFFINARCFFFQRNGTRPDFPVHLTTLEWEYMRILRAWRVHFSKRRCKSMYIHSYIINMNIKRFFNALPVDINYVNAYKMKCSFLLKNVIYSYL